jgi:probable HAF family extracellular repeat protein
MSALDVATAERIGSDSLVNTSHLQGKFLNFRSARQYHDVSSRLGRSARMRFEVSTNMLRKILRSALAVGAVGLGSAVANAQEVTNLRDLGAVAPGLGINDSGQVVLQNYLYSNGTLTAFPTNFSGAGINAAGEVVGSVGAAYTGPGVNCPIVGLDSGTGCAIAVYASGVLTTEPLYAPPGTSPNDPDLGNQGLGINASGAIVGDWNYVHGLGNALVLSHGTFATFAFPGNTCSDPNGSTATATGVAYGINDAGQIVGLLPTGPTCQPGAFLYSSGSYFGIGTGQANAINASGQVTGSLQFGSTTAAFLYSAGGTPVNLGTLPGNVSSSGYGINSQGLVVGTSESGGNVATSVNHAFLYNGVMNDLNALVLPADPLKAFVTLTDARGINDSNLVIVNGIDSRNNSNHAYLMQLPFIEVSIKASASTVTVGTSVTLTWTTSPSSASGVTCTATGGSSADGWTGTIASTGTKAVTESSPGTYTYGISCTVESQTEMAQTSVAVTAAAPVASKSGGGGAFDALSLLFLCGASALHRIVRREIRLVH